MKSSPSKKNSTPKNANSFINFPQYYKLIILLKLGAWEKWPNSGNSYMKDQLAINILNGAKAKLDSHGRPSKRVLLTLLNKVAVKEINQESIVEKNLLQLSKDFKLNQFEADLTRLLYYTSSDKALSECTQLIAKSGFTTEMFDEYASLLLDARQEDIDKFIKERPSIINCNTEYSDGMLTPSNRYYIPINIIKRLDKGEVIDNPGRWIDDIIEHTKPEPLEPSSIKNMEDDLKLASQYLAKVIENKIPSVNILFKGENTHDSKRFAAAVASQVGAKVLEVTSEKHNCQENNFLIKHDLDERFDHFQQAQQLYKGVDNTIVIFDDAVEFFLLMNNIDPNLLGDQLPHNDLPVIWAMDTDDEIDNFLYHQFDLVVNVSLSHQYSRRVILDKFLSEYNLEEAWLNKMSNNKAISEPLIKNMCKVISTLELKEPLKIQQNINKMMMNFQGKPTNKRTSRRMSRNRKVNENRPASSGDKYDISLINANIDMHDLAVGLTKSGEGRIILTGPPGTGKTAFANYLAQSTGRDLSVQTGSSLLGSYIGETEHNIAVAFSEAAQNSSVLLVDEADSFLGSRNMTHQRWESGMTNEFLVQMENFKGIMIACSNLKNRLDSAIQRRFDFKVELDFMSREQMQKMFVLLLGDDDSEIKKHLDQVATGEFSERTQSLRNITPGDFKAVMRRLNILGKLVTHSELIKGLKEESRLKPEFSQQSKSIGFMASV